MDALSMLFDGFVAVLQPENLLYLVGGVLDVYKRQPTSSYLQSYTIIQVEDKEKRAALMEFSGGQKWLVNAPLVLLFCGDLHRDDQLLHPADQNVLHNAELFTVAVSDASLVAQRAFIAAQALGLGLSLIHI